MFSFKNSREDNATATESTINKETAKAFIARFQEALSIVNMVHSKIEPHPIKKLRAGDCSLITSKMDILGSSLTLKMNFSIDSKEPTSICILPDEGE